MDPQYFTLLEKALQDGYVPHLPPLLDQTKPSDQQARKNLSRAFSAFALRAVLRDLCDLAESDCSKSVVDDFDDNGIDAVHYHAASETLYLIQGKLKATETFDLADALKFCQGVKKLLRQDFDGFNKHLKMRQDELLGAVENCSHIVLVVAHVGLGISKHADQTLGEFLSEGQTEDDRLVRPYIDFDAKKAIASLLATKAVERVNAILTLHKCKSISQPRETFFGIIDVLELVKLHKVYGTALYERNIRSYLGHKTTVNTSIKQTLESDAESFFYLNNGVTLLADIIEPKNVKSESRTLKMRGISVINGAQTIATAAETQCDTQSCDISKAKVMLTIVKAGADSDFGKAVTRSRNHQNPVALSNFAALDDEQERLRKELAYLGFQYSYRASAADAVSDPARIRFEEAMQALSMLHPDPRYVVWIKKEPRLLVDASRPQYKNLFDANVTGLRVANAVLVNRYASGQVALQALAANGKTRTAYKNLLFFIAWVLLKQVRDEIHGPKLLVLPAIEANLSKPFDDLREICRDEILKISEPGPLAISRSFTHAIPLLLKIVVRHFEREDDPVVTHKIGQQAADELYPVALFMYLMSKAPQIGNLS